MFYDEEKNISNDDDWSPLPTEKKYSVWFTYVIFVLLQKFIYETFFSKVSQSLSQERNMYLASFLPRECVFNTTLGI